MCRPGVFITALCLIFLSQLLLFPMGSQEFNLFTFFWGRIGFAANPDANSGSNVRPQGATNIKQTPDSRWVIYDRGDKTDWLKVSPQAIKGSQLIIRFNVLQVKGIVAIEVYGKDPEKQLLCQQQRLCQKRLKFWLLLHPLRSLQRYQTRNFGRLANVMGFPRIFCGLLV